MQAGTVDSEVGETGLSRLSRDERSNAVLLRRCNGEVESGDVARGVETEGEAIEEDPLDRLAPCRASSPKVSTELREEEGKATAVDILSTFGSREEEAEGAEVPECDMIDSAPVGEVLGAIFDVGIVNVATAVLMVMRRRATMEMRLALPRLDWRREAVQWKRAQCRSKDDDAARSSARGDAQARAFVFLDQALSK